MRSWHRTRCSSSGRAAVTVATVPVWCVAMVTSAAVSLAGSCGLWAPLLWNHIPSPSQSQVFIQRLQLWLCSRYRIFRNVQFISLTVDNHGDTEKSTFGCSECWGEPGRRLHLWLVKLCWIIQQCLTTVPYYCYERGTRHHSSKHTAVPSNGHRCNKEVVKLSHSVLLLLMNLVVTVWLPLQPQDSPPVMLAAVTNPVVRADGDDERISSSRDSAVCLYCTLHSQCCCVWIRMEQCLVLFSVSCFFSSSSSLLPLTSTSILIIFLTYMGHPGKAKFNSVPTCFQQNIQLTGS